MSTSDSMDEFRSFKIFTPSPILGYGFDVKEFWHTVRQEQPAAIIIDSGSTDPGPHMLGTGKTLCSRQSYIRDLNEILEACAHFNIQVLISSAGGAGTNDQVDIIVSCIEQIALEKSYSFNLATIKLDVDRGILLAKLEAGEIVSCSSSPALTKVDVQDASEIVAQMGAEPFLQALKIPYLDIIVAGRSYDPSPFAAYCIHHGVEESTAWHVGKIIECGGLCAVPKGRSILATMSRDSFLLTPTDPKQRCSPVSVAAHTLYEKTRPDRLPGPGGVLHLDECTYTASRDGRSVLVSGSRFVPTIPYQLKFEAATLVGFRTTFLGGIRDPVLISGIDRFLLHVRDLTVAAFSAMTDRDGPNLIFHQYGRNAVLGQIENEDRLPHEIGLLGEVVARSQDEADAIAGYARTLVLHGAYEGQIATGGNIALPLTPLEASMGPVFKFSIYHLVEPGDPCSMFPIQTTSIGQPAHRRVRGHRLSSTPHTLRDDQNSVSYDSCVESEVLGHGVSVLMIPADCKTPEVTSPSAKLPRNGVLLKDIASVIRSKNAGPFEITLDVLFQSRDDYDHVMASQTLTSELVGRIYHLRTIEDVVICMFYKPALAWKCTFRRYQPQGSIGERDTFGTQMHTPLLNIYIPGTA